MHMLLLLLLATTLVRCLDLNNNLKNKLTSDLDICCTGSPWYYLGHIHWSRSEFSITGRQVLVWMQLQSHDGKVMMLGKPCHSVWKADLNWKLYSPSTCHWYYDALTSAVQCLNAMTNSTLF